MKRRSVLLGLVSSALAPRAFAEASRVDFPDATKIEGIGRGDDSTIINGLIDRFGGVRLGKSHAIANVIQINRNNVKIIGHPEGTTLTMLSGEGQFDKSDFKVRSGRFAGMFAREIDGLQMTGVKFAFQRQPTLRTASAIDLTLCQNATLTDCGAFDFQDSLKPVVNLDSCHNVRLTRLTVKNILSIQKSVAPGQHRVQITGLGIDGDRQRQVNSNNIVIDSPVIDSVRIAPELARQVGDQCDGINVNTFGGGSGKIINPFIRDIGGEGMDIFGWDWSLEGGQFVDMDNHAIKLIHGCKRFHASNFKITRTGGSAIVIGGSNAEKNGATGEVTDADIGNFTVLGVGEIKPASGRKYIQCVLNIDGNNAKFQPTNCRVHDFSAVNTGQMENIVRMQGGSHVTVDRFDYNSVQISEAAISPSALKSGFKVERTRGALSNQ